MKEHNSTSHCMEYVLIFIYKYVFHTDMIVLFILLFKFLFILFFFLDLHIFAIYVSQLQCWWPVYTSCSFRVKLMGLTRLNKDYYSYYFGPMCVTLCTMFCGLSIWIEDKSKKQLQRWFSCAWNPKSLQKLTKTSLNWAKKLMRQRI